MDSQIFYIYGRFQPFTLGHKYLFDSMASLAKTSKKSHVYLFVSYSSKKPSASKKVLAELKDLVTDKSNLNRIKELLKKKNSIFDSPLDNSMKMEIISAVLDKPISEDGEIVYKKNGVSFHIVDCSSSLYEYTKDKTANGFFGAFSFLKNRHSDVDDINIKMFTGSDRDTSRIKIPFKVFDRNNANSSLNTSVTKLSGSKIRALSLVHGVDDIHNMYNGTISKSLIKKLIIKPINMVIMGEYKHTITSINNSKPSKPSKPSKGINKKKASLSSTLNKLLEQDSMGYATNNSHNSINTIRAAIHSAKSNKKRKSIGVGKHSIKLMRLANDSSLLDKIDD